MAAKSKMASKTYGFVFLLSMVQFSPDSKILFCIRSVFLWKKLFSRNQNGGLAQDVVIFGKLSFFSICKSQFVVPRKKNKMAEIFKMAFALL
jgi:hypothetical protein